MRPAKLGRIATASMLTLLVGSARTDEAPARSGLEERVEVYLVEVKVRVNDGQGRPVKDIDASEVRVLEGGIEQRVAYFEPLARRAGVLVAAGEAVTPAKLYDGSGQPVETDSSAVVPPPIPRRRVIFVFDPRNSRQTTRDAWRTAALDWVRNSMGPDDMAGVVVLRTWPEWIATPTADRARVADSLLGLDLHTNIPDRNRRDEMSAFVNDLQHLCSKEDVQQRGGTGGAPTDLSADEASCAYSLARPLVQEWSVQTSESIDNLRALAGQLAAIPEEKAVILFSEGLVEDPAQVAVSAMIGVFGESTIDLSSMASRLRVLTLNDLSGLYDIAVAADAAFFTLDTRSPNDSSTFFDIEQSSAPTTNRLGINPYREMYEATRAPLAALAYATGGRPYSGPDELDSKVGAAAEAFYAVYTLGYYRTAGTIPGKVKIKIDRDKVKLDYDNRPRRQAHQPRPLQVELAVGRPVALPDGRHRLPVAVVTAVESLPLRKGAGGRGLELGVFAQAVRPDGTVAGEAFEVTTFVLTPEQLEKKEVPFFRHVLELELPAGPVRIRARLSDDRQTVIGDRAIDLTLEDNGEVRGGL